jgi:hypothetical protein
VWSAGQDVHGKIDEALWLTSEYPEEIEADLHRYYRLDFVDLWRPGSSLTWRKLLVLVHHLPPEAAVNTAIRNDVPEHELARRGSEANPEQASWSSLESLIALLIDEVRSQTWAYIQMKTDKRVPRPTPIRRPGVSGRRERTITLASAQRLDPRLRGLSDQEAQQRLDEILGRNRRG